MSLWMTPCLTGIVPPYTWTPFNPDVALTHSTDQIENLGYPYPMLNSSGRPATNK